MNAKRTRKGRKDSGKVWRLVPNDALIVTVRDGPLDPDGTNAALQRLMRRHNARQNLKLTQELPGSLVARNLKRWASTDRSV